MNLYLSLTLEKENIRHTAPLTAALLWLWLIVAYPMLGMWGAQVESMLWQAVEWNHRMLVSLMVMSIVARVAYSVLRENVGA